MKVQEVSLRHIGEGYFKQARLHFDIGGAGAHL